MAGILDKKSRVMDVLLTEYGRKEFAKGGFDVQFVSFSDRNVDYIGDENNVLQIDDSTIVSFEAFSSQSDVLIPEYSNVGDFSLTGKISPDIYVENGVLKSVEFDVDETVIISDLYNFDIGDLTVDQFEKRYINLGILRNLEGNNTFNLSSKAGNVSYISEAFQGRTEVNSIKPISIDPRFARSINTKILEPIFKQGESSVYLDTPEPAENITYEEFMAEVDNSIAHVDFEFGQESDSFDIIGQIMVLKDGKLRKLMVHSANEEYGNDGRIISKVFHVGEIFKTYNDNTNIDTITRFGRTFSIVFHDGSLYNAE